MARKPSVSEITATIGRGGRSPLYLWMWDNFEEIRAALLGRADWIGATAKFSALGYTGRNGIPLNPENVRKTWSRVVADRGRKAPGAAPKRTEVPPPTPKPVPPAPVAEPVQPEGADDFVEPRSRFSGRPAVSRFIPKGDE